MLSSNLLLSHPFFSSGILQWEKDINSTFKSVNDCFMKVYSFKDSEIIGKTDYDISNSSTDLAELFRECDKEVSLNKKSLRFLETVKDKNNSWKMLLTTKVPLLNSYSKVEGTTGYAVDITFPFFPIGRALADIKNSKAPPTFNHKKILTLINSKQTMRNLTSKQLEVIFLLLRHKTAKEIAQFLKVSYRSVEDRIERIKGKLNCQSRSELIDKTIELGLFNMIPESFLNTHTCVFLGESN